MPRTSRIVIPGVPHHIVQRGNRKQNVFFSDHDRMYYLRMLKEHARIYGIKIWSYCLMDNHVHLIVVPQEKESFRAIAETHRRYTYMINTREGWRGYLWQGRFKSYPMDERYVFAGIRYVERNPVRAGMVLKAEGYRWSSAKAHVLRIEDELLEDFFLLDEVLDWRAYLSSADQEEDLDLLRRTPHRLFAEEGTH